MEEATVATLGKCPGCLRMGHLKRGTCKHCQKFGRNFGQMATRIRTEPGFKAKCYAALSNDYTRQEFVVMFGPLEETG